MKICFIGDGESVHNHFMIDWFVKHKHNVVFLTDTPVGGVHCPVHQVAPKKRGGFMRHWRASRKVKKFIKQWKPDIVHAHNVTGYGYWGALCGFHPFVLTAWGSDLMIEVHKNAIVREAVRYALRKADLITADAKSLAETAEDLARNNADVRELQWGVYPKEFDRERAPQTRAKYRQDADYVFVSNRRPRPIYNIDVIVRAFARALPQMKGARLVVIGDDHQSDDLRRLAEHVCAEQFITFTGWLDRTEMVNALLASDCYISVPSSDSTPLSLLEAFAARLPVIVSDLPAMHEWVMQGENGMIVRSNHESQLTQAMIRAFKNPQACAQWGLANRKLVEKRGDRNNEMNKLLSWYQELLDKNN